eukprot:Nk52_evm1s1001 gene=Nk52_evmTU1s1001
MASTKTVEESHTQKNISQTGAYVKDLYKNHSSDYAGEKKKGWRVDMERYSTLKWIGDVTGKRVLDLGSGDGVYSRLMAAKGAREVVGVDISEDMCSLSKKSTSSPVVTYLEGNCMDLEEMKRILPEQEGSFDIILCSCLLCNCRSVHEVDGLAEVIGHFLNRETGVFAGMDHFPDEKEYDELMFVEKFGFSKWFEDRSVDGSKLIIKLYGLGDDKSVVMPITNYHYSMKCLCEHFGKYGLSIECPPMDADPSATGGTYDLMVENPTFCILNGSHMK